MDNNAPEKRCCAACGHTGSDMDASDTKSWCAGCMETVEYPVDDVCQECGATNCMMLACPECGGEYSLDEGDIDDCLDIYEDDADNCIHDCGPLDEDDDDAAFAADEKARIAALHKSAPEVIWLQVDPEAEQFDGWEAQTWCSDKINETDVKYVRADLTQNVEVTGA